MIKCLLTSNSYDSMASYCKHVGMKESSLNCMLTGRTRMMTLATTAKSFSEKALIDRLKTINAMSACRAVVDTKTGMVWKSVAAMIKDGKEMIPGRMVMVNDMLMEHGFGIEKHVHVKKRSGRPSRSVVNTSTGEVIDSLTDFANRFGCSVGHAHKELSKGEYLGWRFCD